MKELEKRQVQCSVSNWFYLYFSLPSDRPFQIETEKHMAQKRAEKQQITEQQVQSFYQLCARQDVTGACTGGGGAPAARGKAGEVYTSEENG
jgi:hypothetical protein